jgi:tryptophan synthase alpha chain
MNDIDTKTLKNSLSIPDHKILSLYYTVGYPMIEDIDVIFQSIEETNKVDFIELGMPYSDPLADGETIQFSSTIAIKNGVTLEKYFSIAQQIKQQYKIPLIFMGYLNQIVQLGIEEFCKSCKESGIEGVIIPDLPIDIYERDYQELFKRYNLLVSFLITPTTTDKRIRKIEKLTTGFIYVVSSNNITGNKSEFSHEQTNYFERIQSLMLSKPSVIGFGIHDKESYEIACKYANGGIIGSAFLRKLENKNLGESVKNFIHSIK